MSHKQLKKKKKLVVLVKNLRLEKKEKEHLVLCKVDTAVNIHHCLQLWAAGSCWTPTTVEIVVTSYENNHTVWK